MGEYNKASLWPYLPHVVFTTCVVVALPVVAVSVLRIQGLVTGILPLLIAGMLISLLVSAVGAAIWRNRPGSGDLLFSELLIWGFLRRWYVDRRLSRAISILRVRGERVDPVEGLAAAEKAKLLEQLTKLS